MAFIENNLTPWSENPIQGTSLPVGVPASWGYYTGTDNFATVTGAGYFNGGTKVLGSSNAVGLLRVNDVIFVNATNASDFIEVLTVSPQITTQAISTGIVPGSIVNADVSAAAAIAYSKLAALPSGDILVGSAGNVATVRAMTGDIGINNAGLTAIQPGVIVNADVNAAAAIAYSKLAALPSGNILVGSAGNVPTSVAMSSDATIIASGALTIANNAITTVKILNANVTSAKLAADTIQYVKVPVTAAQWNGMYAAPFIMIAAPGAGQMIVVKQAIFAMTFVSAAYLVGGNVALQYDSTVNGAGTLASAVVSAVTVDGYVASSSVGVAGAQVSAAITTTVAKGLYLSNDTAAFTTGDSTWNVHIWYSVVTL